MGTIYVATNDIVITGSYFDHLYLVYDPDDDPNNQNESIIRGGPSATLYLLAGYATSIVGSTDNHVDETTGNVIENPYTERYFRDITDLFAGLQAENVWAYMSAHAQAIEDAGLSYESEQNSNSVVASVLNSTGFNYYGLLPFAPSGENNWIGVTNTLTSIVPPVDGYLYSDGARYQLGTSSSNTFSGADHINRDYVFDGGDGADTVDYSNYNSSVYITVQPDNWFSDNLGNELWNIENIMGTSYSDILRGNAADNIIWGEGGDDTIYGSFGNDILYGGGLESLVAIP